MSYGFPSEQPGRRKGGGMFFLIILAVGAFLFFSNRGGPQLPPGDTAQPPSGSHADRELDSDREYSRQRDEILGKDDIAKGQRMPSTGQTGAAADWAIDDVASQKNATGSKTNQQSTTRTGDWAIEDVDNKQDDNQFKFSETKKTPANDDWAIEDVKKNKKTESGDWAIEETTTSDKDK